MLLKFQIVTKVKDLFSGISVETSNACPILLLSVMNRYNNLNSFFADRPDRSKNVSRCTLAANLRGQKGD